MWSSDKIVSEASNVVACNASLHCYRDFLPSKAKEPSCHHEQPDLNQTKLWRWFRSVDRNLTTHINGQETQPLITIPRKRIELTEEDWMQIHLTMQQYISFEDRSFSRSDHKQQKTE